MRLHFLMAVVVLALVGFSRDAAAYAWMVRHGYVKCSTCHTDPSGGETLGHMGRVSSQTLLSQQWGDDDELTDLSKFAFGLSEPDWLRLGGSARSMTLQSMDSEETLFFPMQLDLYGSLALGPVSAGFSVGASRASGRFEHTDKALLAGTTERGTLVAVSRSHWLGFEPGSQMLLRAGRLNLPFGLRVSEHTLWARDVTLTDRESDQQHGLAFAFWRGHFRGELMAVAGNFQLPDDDTRERGYAGYLEVLPSDRLAIGVNSQLLQSKRGLLSGLADERRQAHGLTFRYSPFPMLALLAEGDALLTSYRELGYVGLLVADLEPLRGIHLILTGEALDRGQRTNTTPTPIATPVIPEDAGPSPGNGEPRYGGWASVAWFPIPHIDVRADVVARQGRPLQLQLMGHLYF